MYEFSPLSEITEEHFDRMYNLNVRGLLFATQAAVNAFGEGGGSVINIGSVASQLGMPATAVYSSTKGALDVITRVLATELGPKKILVNAVLPGPVETEGAKSLPGFDAMVDQTMPRVPLGRVGQPSDIAKVVSFLASADSGWISGQIIQAAGGLQ